MNMLTLYCDTCNYTTGSFSLNGRQTVAYTHFLSELKEHKAMTEDAFEVISQFLVIEPSKRLGFGPRPLRDIKKYSFFSPLDWHQVGLLQMPPPFIPQIKHNDAVSHISFEDMMKYVDTNTSALPFKNSGLTPKEDKFFEEW